MNKRVQFSLRNGIDLRLFLFAFGFALLQVSLFLRGIGGNRDVATIASAAGTLVNAASTFIPNTKIGFKQIEAEEQIPSGGASKLAQWAKVYESRSVRIVGIVIFVYTLLVSHAIRVGWSGSLTSSVLWEIIPSYVFAHLIAFAFVGRESKARKIGISRCATALSCFSMTSACIMLAALLASSLVWTTVIALLIISISEVWQRVRTKKSSATKS